MLYGRPAARAPRSAREASRHPPEADGALFASLLAAAQRVAFRRAATAPLDAPVLDGEADAEGGLLVCGEVVPQQAPMLSRK